ncbi:hypothetical protein BDEG_20573 [Batrachochytrium dendrobatidis JEL423]|uniref:BHLH domain-containing protein n=1 Tax=Batrachochytrium dendrobatidis (strain JEL423) TaxID=403673 RepID=A0A177W8K5_BATDL|nr:hypothetical protein BDEG_20573 [Batrachochytrium dendrobatidis JEL423]
MPFTQLQSASNPTEVVIGINTETAPTSGSNDESNLHKLVPQYLQQQSPHFHQYQFQQQQYQQLMPFDALLISPAMTPITHFGHMSISGSSSNDVFHGSAATTDGLFSPITSPALKTNIQSMNDFNSPNIINHPNNFTLSTPISDVCSDNIHAQTPLNVFHYNTSVGASATPGRVASPFLSPTAGMALTMLPPAVLPTSDSISASHDVSSMHDYNNLHLLQLQQQQQSQFNAERKSTPLADDLQPLSTPGISGAPKIERTQSSQSWRRNQYSPYMFPRKSVAQSPLSTGTNVLHRGSISSADNLNTPQLEPIQYAYAPSDIFSSSNMAIPSPLAVGSDSFVSATNLQQLIDFHASRISSPISMQPTHPQSTFKPPSRSFSTSDSMKTQAVDLSKSNPQFDAFLTPTDMTPSAVMDTSQHHFSLSDIIQHDSGETMHASSNVARITPAQLMDIQQQKQQRQASLSIKTMPLKEDSVGIPALGQMDPATMALLKFPDTIVPIAQFKFQKSLPSSPQSYSQADLHSRPLSHQSKKQLPLVFPKPSPALKPLLPNNGSLTHEDAALKLAEKSNYQNILEGNSEKLGLCFSAEITSSVEVRKSTHKQAEQLRRDTLKSCFDEIRSLLPPIAEKLPSRVVVIRAAHDYITTLHEESKTQKLEIESLKARIKQLENGLSDGSSHMSQASPLFKYIQYPESQVENSEKSVIHSPYKDMDN